jgi:hypothetical protein
MAFLGSACDEECPVREYKHEVVDVTATAVNAGEVARCAQSGDCRDLCTQTAMTRAHAHVVVDSCTRVERDGGMDGATEAGAPDGGTPGDTTQVTLDISYRVFEFCGV